MNEADFRLTDGHEVTRIDAASKALTVGAFARLPAEARGAKWRLLLEAQGEGQMDVLGGKKERSLNNTLQVQGQALDMVRGMEEGRIEIREASMGAEFILLYEGEQVQKGTAVT